MEPDALNLLLAGTPQPCPSCGYTLRAAPDSRCPECGSALHAQVALREPYAALANAFLVCCAFPAANALRRMLFYAVHLPQVGDDLRRVDTIPWYFVLLEVSILATPFIFIAGIVFRHRLRALPRWQCASLCALVLLPYLLDSALLLLH